MEDNRTSIGSNRNKRIIMCCVAVIVALVFAIAGFVYDIFQYNTGVVREISVVRSGSNQLDLKLTYFLPMGGYSVREVPQDEGEYIGDGMIDYDGSLGKYRIIIEFGDIDSHISFWKKSAKNGFFELNNSLVTLKAKIACPGDHGFVLYIGSDTPLHVEETGTSDLEGIFGTISIPITIGSE